MMMMRIITKTTTPPIIPPLPAELLLPPCSVLEITSRDDNDVEVLVEMKVFLECTVLDDEVV